MSEGIHYIPEPPEAFDHVPEKKKNKTLWIIVAIVAVILLCCCLAVGLALVLGFSIPAYDQLFFHFLPNLSWI